MEIDYYGNNDWRDYCLAHHGIMGMHWGIRRFQPYSTTGPRKGGKTGKEIGLARRLGRGIKAGVTRYKQKHAENKIRKAERAEIKKAEKIAAEKEDIIKSGSAERMLNRRELFTNDEIDAFVNRANKEAQLERIKQLQAANATPVEPKKGFFEARKEKKLQQEKDEIMKSGSIERLLENKDKFSTEEIGAFIDRANKEKNLRDLKKQIDDQKIAEVENNVKRIVSYLGTANALAREGLALKGNVDSIKDALGVSSKKQIEKQINDAISSGDAQRFLDISDKASNDQVKDARLRFDNLAAIRKNVGESSSTNGSSNVDNNAAKQPTTSKRENNNVGLYDFKDEKAFTKDDISGSLKSLMTKNGDISREKPTNKDIGLYDFKDEKPFTKSDMSDSLKSLVEKNSTATHFPKSLDRSIGTKDYANEKAFTRSDLGNSTLNSLISKTSNQKDSIDKGRDALNSLISGAKEAGRSASEGASNARAAGSKIADALKIAANGSKGYNDAAHLGQETARQILSGNYSKMPSLSNSGSTSNKTSTSSTPSKPKESVESIIQREYGHMFDSGTVPKSSSSSSSSTPRASTSTAASSSSKSDHNVETLLQRDYGYMFDSGMTPKGSSARSSGRSSSGSSSSDANRRALENLASLTKKTSDLSAQTAKVDDGRDYVEELLRRTKL